MNEIEIKIDYFSTTFPLDVDADEEVMFKVHEMVRLIATYLNIQNFEVIKSKYTQNNYNYQFILGESIILRLDGPRNDCYQKTCHLEMKGEACREFERRNPDKTWMNLLLFIAELNGRFKRVDIAIDDFKGQYITLDFLKNKLDKKQYTSVFRSTPNPMGTLENGLTLQFGTHESPIELVIYDKKMERKKRKKPTDKAYWVRYEMRFRNVCAQRIIFQLVSEFEDKNNPVYGLKIQKFAFEQLYRILDIKEVNNYDARNQNKVQTDQRWKEFLKDVEKGTLVKLESTLPKTFEAYMKAATPYVSMWLLLKYLRVLRDPYLFEIEIYKYMHQYVQFSKQRFQRLNIYLNQFNLKTIDDKTLLELKEEFRGIMEEKELPF